MSAAWNGPIVAALVALVMAKYFADSIDGVGPSGDLGVLAASASAAAAADVLAVAVAAAAVQAAAADAVFLAAAAVHGVAAFVVVAVAVVAAAVHAAAAAVSVPDVAAFVAVVVAVVVVVVVAAAVRTAAVVLDDDVVLAVDVVHAAVGFGFVAVLVVHSVAVVWVGIDVAAVVVFQWASRIVAADAGNGEQVGHPLVADPVTAALVGPLQMGKHCCTA